MKAGIQKSSSREKECPELGPAWGGQRFRQQSAQTLVVFVGGNPAVLPLQVLNVSSTENKSSLQAF